MVLVRADLCGGVAGGGRRIGVAAIVLVGLFAGTLPTSASAFTVTSAGPTVTVSSGDAADDVAVSDGPGGSVVVEVSGQVPNGTTASCTWDEDRAQLACPAGTPVQAELEAGDDALSVTGGATVIGIGGAGNDVIDGAFESHGGDGADQLVMGSASGRGRAFGDDGPTGGLSRYRLKPDADGVQLVALDGRTHRERWSTGPPPTS